jgi:nicotinamide-nucleotide amidase
VRVGQALLERKLMLACAESCTGGWVAEVVTATGGSSQWFERGYVTYSNAAKQEMLGVRAETLRQHGAVSEAVVARDGGRGAQAQPCPGGPGHFGHCGPDGWLT